MLSLTVSILDLNLAEREFWFWMRRDTLPMMVATTHAPMKRATVQ
jgi:hypothetical protein